MIKRMISLLLVLVMITGMVPVFAQAEEVQTTVDNGELTVEGTNSFGDLVSQGMSQAMNTIEEGQSESGYGVTDLEIAGSTAIVTYESLEEAVLVVAIYTEDGARLLTSATQTVSADSTEARVLLPQITEPYFLAEAFLLDTYDHAPLCESFETPMYTSDMQTLLGSTVGDYDPERVYNLDSDRTTNFAVFAEDTVIIKEASGTNTLVSADDANYIYTFENADAQITDLSAGSVVAYQYGSNQLLLFKTASVITEGTKATVTGGPLEVEEVFAYMKLENKGDPSQIMLDTDYTDEGFIYEGMSGGKQTRSWDNSLSSTLSYEYKLADFYYSFDHQQWGWDECPHYLFQVRVLTLKADGSRAANVPVTVNTGYDMGESNANGLAIGYLPKGNHTFIADIDGRRVAYTKMVTYYCNVTLTANEQYYEAVRDAEKLQIKPDEALAVAQVASGNCGSNAKWTLYASGLLKITGSGNMDNYYIASNAPWYHFRDKIRSIHVSDEVSSVGQNAFVESINLTKVVLDDCVTSLGSGAFTNCTGLREVKLPVGMANAKCFDGCGGVQKIHYTYGTTGTMVSRATYSANFNFYQYTLEYISRAALKTVIFDERINSIANYAFYQCSALTEIVLSGECPTVDYNAFSGVTATVYYPVGDATYTETAKNAFGGTMTWVSYIPEQEPEETAATVSLTGTVRKEINTAYAVYEGDTQTELIEETAYQISTFEGLVPDAQYVMLAVVSLDTENLLAADNLLFIDQAAADENGTLTFRYVQRVPTDEYYVFVCGASGKNLQDAMITIPALTANTEAQDLPLTVTDGDQILLEGVHYVIAEGAVFTDSGTYTATLRGINQYSGLVTVEYTVAEKSAVIQPVLTLKSPALEFKDMIKVVAFFTAENLDDVVEMGMITYKSQVDVVDIATADYVIPGADYEESSKRYFSSSQGIHAKYLADTVYLACYAKLTDGSYVYTKLAPYSPITYATNQLKNSTNASLKQLVVAMLNYGAAAQVYFNHNVENPANAALTAEQLALPESYRADMVSAVPAVPAEKQGIFANNQGFSSRRPAVSFEGAFSINYFFTPKYEPVDGITLYYWTEADFGNTDVLSVDNATGSIVMAGRAVEQYRGDIDGISAKNLSQAVYVAAIYSDGTTTWTSGVLGYSIGAYCSSQATKGGTMADLAMATAVYGYHANQYFG